MLPLLILLGVTFTSCTTKKNTTTTRAFHNLTAKYNYYFNANEIFQESTRRASENFTFNYTQPIPVFLSGRVEIRSNVSGDMDRAITKCTNLISRHSITVKPERRRGNVSAKRRNFYSQTEFIRWAREAWLLIGKARVWKGDLVGASQTFEHIILQFPNTNLWHEAHVWQARIDILNGDYQWASDRLSGISSNRRYPKGKYYTHLLESTWAELYLRQGNTQQALKFLSKALENAPDRIHRVRYTFLLAQLNQRQGKYAESTRLFRRIIRMNSPYEMTFNARISIASMGHGGGRGQEMRRQLNRMAADEKNKEFLDQIYFALGRIEQAEGNTQRAVEFFKKSASSSVNNRNQKGLSYLTLADYYFEKPNYTQSQAYYDSAYNALDETFPDFRNLEVKALNLNKLVQNLNIIQHQDSLLRVAQMPERERDALIASLIRKVRDDEERARREEQEDRDRFIQFQQTQRFQQNQTQEGKWYFYNQSSLSFGQSEFRSRWGQRKLEDNWRRKNRRVMSPDPILTTADNVAADGGEAVKVVDSKSREYYLQHLPLTDSLKALAHSQIVEAMLRVGDVYQNDLKDFDEAVAAYQRLIDRYPGSIHALEAHYNIYQIYRFNNSMADAERYKQLIINGFPQSHYALMLSNPNFLDEMRAKRARENQEYEETYNLFAQGQYAQAIQKARSALSQGLGNELASKHQLIVALCTGNLAGIEAYKQSLAEVTEKFPGTDAANKALGIIELLRSQELQLASALPDAGAGIDPSTTTTTPSVNYLAPQGEHLFIALVPKKASLNQLRFNFISFNVDHYINLDLKVANRELNQYLEIITIEPFRNQREAMDYLRRASAEEGLLGALPPSDYTLLVISRENLNILIKEQSAVAYINFFRANY